MLHQPTNSHSHPCSYIDATCFYSIVLGPVEVYLDHRRRNRGGGQGARAPPNAMIEGAGIFGMSFFQNRLITSTVNNCDLFLIKK